MKSLRTYIFFMVCYASLWSLSAGNVLDEFTISLDRAQVLRYSESSLELESESPVYRVKLEPNTDGAVMFSLGRHAYRSSLIFKNLFFGVQIHGYKDGEILQSTLVIDDSFDELHVDGNFIAFQSIKKPIPVLFKTGVDSIILRCSNNQGWNFHQYFSIDGLQVLGAEKIIENPPLIDCNQHSIMIAIEGSGSIEKSERKTIAKELMRFFKRPPESLDSNAVCILQFGKSVTAVSESVEEKQIVKNVKTYKKTKTSKKANYSNWGAALEEALEREPDVFILVTKTWSNYLDDGPSSITGQHRKLVEKCNQLKANGTRLLFITAGLNQGGDSNMTLWAMLDEDNTTEITGSEVENVKDLKDVDLISMDGFKRFSSIDLTSLLVCDE